MSKPLRELGHVPAEPLCGFYKFQFKNFKRQFFSMQQNKPPYSR